MKIGTVFAGCLESVTKLVRSSNGRKLDCGCRATSVLNTGNINQGDGISYWVK